MAATPDLQPTALLALDWGTSSLRGARIDATGRVMDERAFPRGILTVPAGGFAEVFDTCFGDWARDGAQACLISGMAGSKQGWVEAPYCACPAGFTDVAAELTALIQTQRAYSSNAKVIQTVDEMLQETTNIKR